jgi:hypothetical protein
LGRWQAGRVFELREEVIVRDEEAFDGTIEYHDIDPIVGLERRDDLIQLRNALRAKDVERRVVEGDAPVTRRALFETDAFLVFSVAHCCLVSMNDKPASGVGTADGHCTAAIRGTAFTS